MRPELHVTTRVLAGGRVEIASPDLQEGQAVEVIVKAAQPAEPSTSQPATQSLVDLMRSFTPSKRTEEEWIEYDRQFQAERDAWD